MPNYQKEIRTKLTKGLLDLIIFEILSQQPMHGYQLISSIRRSFGVYFGPSTIYPLLNSLEAKGYIKSTWNVAGERPKKLFELTPEGKTVLNFAETSLNVICKTMAIDYKTKVVPEYATELITFADN